MEGDIVNSRQRIGHQFFPAAIAAFLLVGFVSTARAQSREGRFQVDPIVGYSAFHVPDNGLSALDLDDGASLGVRFGYGITRAWQIEIEYSRTETDLLFAAPLDPETPLYGLTVDTLLAFGTYHLASGRIVPYVTAGAGITRIDSGVPVAGCPPPFACIASLVPVPDVRYDETNLTFAAGLGVKAVVSDHVGVRIDARGYAIDQETAFFVPGAPDGEWITTGMVSAGLLYVF
jgi:opacity protein-like surface antigen